MAFFQNFGATNNKQPDAYNGFTANTVAPAAEVSGQKPFSGLMSYVNGENANTGSRQVVSSRPTEQKMEGATANNTNVVNKQSEISNTSLEMAQPGQAPAPQPVAQVQSAFKTASAPQSTRSFTEGQIRLQQGGIGDNANALFAGRPTNQPVATSTDTGGVRGYTMNIVNGGRGAPSTNAVKYGTALEQHNKNLTNGSNALTSVQKQLTPLGSVEATAAQKAAAAKYVGDAGFGNKIGIDSATGKIATDAKSVAIYNLDKQIADYQKELNSGGYNRTDQKMYEFFIRKAVEQRNAIMNGTPLPPPPPKSATQLTGEAMVKYFSDENLKTNINEANGDEITRILNDLTNGAR